MRTATSNLSMPRSIAVALFALAAVALTALLDGCGVTLAPSPEPNAGLFRDFTADKFDRAGHPNNATVTVAQALCASAGTQHNGVLALTATCSGELPGTAQRGELVANARLRVASSHTDPIARLELRDADGAMLASETVTAARVRDASGWVDVALAFASDGRPARIAIAPAGDAVIELDYVETFAQRFGLVLAPGSGELADRDALQIELARDRDITTVAANGVDVTARFADLVASGVATRTDTEFRSIIEVPIGALLPTRADLVELDVRTATDAARVELRRAPPPCQFEGDGGGIKVLVTGFQPFPADSWHDNVSGVAVRALDPAALRGARAMRLVLPVEYDRAAAELAATIARCEPQIVISFGQGGDSIALEEVAYNLEDTSEVVGGVPDNRGIVRAAVPIDPQAPAKRNTLLPIASLERALVAIGEAPQRSRDPGRYICNDVMFAGLAAIGNRPRARAGFIHLPYMTTFDDATRARFGKVVATAIQATVDAQPTR